MRCAECGWSGPVGAGTSQDTCPKCGAPLTEDNVAPGESTSVPTSEGSSDVPKGRQVISIVGALNLRRPQWATEQSQFHYLDYEEEVHYATLRKQYPDVADKIK